MESKARPRSVIKRDQVRAEGAGTRPRPRAQSETGHDTQHERHDEVQAVGAASVRLLSLDENTQALELTCSCGEVSLIEIRTEKKP